MLHGFLWCPWLNCAHSGMVWKISSLCTSSVGTQSCPWPLKMMTSQAVEGMWIPMGSYGRLTGKSVKQQVFWRNALLSIDLGIVLQDYSSPSTRPQTACSPCHLWGGRCHCVNWELTLCTNTKELFLISPPPDPGTRYSGTPIFNLPCNNIPDQAINIISVSWQKLR